MRDVAAEFKEMRLYGMAGAWADLVAQGTNASLDTSGWLIEHLLAAERTERSVRSTSNQMNAAKFPVHRDLAGFDFTQSRRIGRWLSSWPICCSPRPRTMWC